MRPKHRTGAVGRLRSGVQREVPCLVAYLRLPSPHTEKVWQRVLYADCVPRVLQVAMQQDAVTCSHRDAFFLKEASALRCVGTCGGVCRHAVVSSLLAAMRETPARPVAVVGR
mmetsp:Transcript_51470/g.166943  ORF Transcript_51470/g.166943 Transcript_51470/m.166943 type:complete len:113 (+) Transcript_51470:2676-3014(+)